MPMDGGMRYTSEAEPGFVERDPTGRYIRVWIYFLTLFQCFFVYSEMQ